jgi:hypothetical protein
LSDSLDGSKSIASNYASNYAFGTLLSFEGIENYFGLVKDINMMTRPANKGDVGAFQYSKTSGNSGLVNLKVARGPSYNTVQEIKIDRSSQVKNRKKLLKK